MSPGRIFHLAPPCQIISDYYSRFHEKSLERDYITTMKEQDNLFYNENRHSSSSITDLKEK